MSFFERLKSRKLIMSILAAIVGAIKVYYPDFPEQALYTIVGSLMGYVLVEGVVDATKRYVVTSDTDVLDNKITNLVKRLSEILNELQQIGKKDSQS
ncbi:MAG: hypothetical protein WC601_10905 [Desulfotomaculaceae bacterium]